MGRRIIGVTVVALVALGLAFAHILIWRAPEPVVVEPSPMVHKIRIKLPEPRYDSNISIEEALLKRSRGAP